MYRAKSVQIFESNWKFLNEQTIPFNFFKKTLTQYLFHTVLSIN